MKAIKIKLILSLFGILLGTNAKAASEVGFEMKCIDNDTRASLSIGADTKGDFSSPLNFFGLIVDASNNRTLKLGLNVRGGTTSDSFLMRRNSELVKFFWQYIEATVFEKSGSVFNAIDHWDGSQMADRYFIRTTDISDGKIVMIDLTSTLGKEISVKIFEQLAPNYYRGKSFGVFFNEDSKFLNGSAFLSSNRYYHRDEIIHSEGSVFVKESKTEMNCAVKKIN